MNFSRLRVEYKKDGIFIYLSNLDIIRYIERALRRSDLPLYFSSGYNPKPKLDFSPALPLGIPSESEIFDFYLTEKIKIEDVFDALEKGFNKDFIVKRIKEVNLNSPSLSSLITHFEIEFYGEFFKNFDFKNFVIKKEKDGKINFFELKNFIFLEEKIEEGKKLILNKNFSLREVYENLKICSERKIFMKKIKNLKIESENIFDIFDID